MAGNRPSVLFSRVRDVLQPNSAGTGYRAERRFAQAVGRPDLQTL